MSLQRCVIPRSLLFLCLIVCLVNATKYFNRMIIPNFEFKCIGHRGYPAGQHPENTFESLEDALIAGADGIELDVHLTSDGYLILMHDDSLERTTNGSGFVWDRPWVNYVNQLRVKRNKMDDITSSEYRVPLFKDALKLLKQYPVALMYIDIKPSNPLHILDKIDIDIRSAGYDHLTSRLVFGVWRADFMEYLATESHLKRYKRSHNSISIEISGHQESSYWKYAENFSLKIEQLHGKAGLDFVETVRTFNPKASIFTWTVDKHDLFELAGNLGLNAVMTNDIKACLLEKSRIFIQ